MSNKRADIIAIIALILLWWLFFWRIFTPNTVDQVSLVDGDFSGQFVTFGAYQYERFADGEIPLWNPYNNAGLPFIADTQAAVFYPPRLMTLFLSKLSGGWSYNTLQLEMTAHVLLYTLFTYALVRRMTKNEHKTASVVGAFVSSIITGYGGFMAAYPPLQLALLEAAIWTPLALLGVLEATRTEQTKWTWLAFSGFTLGCSWMAGHPQTSWFATYLIVIYLAYRIFAASGTFLWKDYLRKVFIGTAIIGIITVGITAVTLFPGIEYLGHTARNEFTFDEKGNGFPFQELVHVFFPNIIGIWSPLYIGIVGLVLAGIALAGKSRDRIFWVTIALITLGMSFGSHTPIFHALYNTLPGLKYFRGQERAAFLVMTSTSILAGMGVLVLYNHFNNPSVMRTLKRILMGWLAISMFITILELTAQNNEALDTLVFISIISGLLLLSLQSPRWIIIIPGLLAFELFTINMDNNLFEPIPTSQQPIMTTPRLVDNVLNDTDSIFRVDGHFSTALSGNAASLYGLQDIRGISPLFLEGPHAIIQRELPTEVAWELFAVKYVFAGPNPVSANSTRLDDEIHKGQQVYLHQLNNPRPFALLMTNYEIADSDQFARALLADPRFDERSTIILDKTPNIDLPDSLPDDAKAEIIEFKPEHITIETSSSQNAILSLALVDYPGWYAEIDGQPVETIRAYGALTAIPVEAGDHTMTLTYSLLSFTIGVMFSLVTWSAMGILGLFLLFKGERTNE